MGNKQNKRFYKINGIDVEVASTAGFCFGVNRAVKITEELTESGLAVATLGPLIHNPQVIAQLAKKGVKTVDTIHGIKIHETAVIRSHGVSRKVKQLLCEHCSNVVDATCPFVTKIHKIAEQCDKAGGILLVAGNSTHPEVEGIVGHTSGEVYVFEDLEQLKAVFSKLDVTKKIYIVAQTTFEVTKWLESSNFLKKECTNCLIFDTICSATWVRQDETEEMARRCEVMLVVGGKGSSNTRKLYKVAAKHTKALHIETANELSSADFEGISTAGITAGASTPLSAIEEVLIRMSDVIREDEMSFEEMLEDSMRPVYAGQIVKGVVEAVSANEVTVDIGTKQTGIIKLEELTDNPEVRSAEEVVKRGDELDLLVTKVNDQEGIVLLSKKQMEARKGVEEVSKAAEDGTILDGFIVESNKGGLVARVKGMKVFIPASQATLRRGDDYTSLVRTKVKLVIKEFSPRRAIGSIREVLEVETKKLRDAFWIDAEEGKVYVGVVKSLTSYGAFVDLGGVDGLVHISELSWNRIKHPSEVVQVGDSIEVYIKEINPDTRKISLGFKKQEDNPWEKLRMEYPIGSVFTAPIVSITPFGAFARILPGIDGLVHISEISHDRVEKVADALSIGQEVEVKLVDADFDRKRISLSMKALIPAPETEIKSGSDEIVASASAEETVVSEDMATELDSEESK